MRLMDYEVMKNKIMDIVKCHEKNARDYPEYPGLLIATITIVLRVPLNLDFIRAVNELEYENRLCILGKRPGSLEGTLSEIAGTLVITPEKMGDDHYRAYCWRRDDQAYHELYPDIKEF